MNEILGLFTAFGTMVAGDHAAPPGPMLCEKQINLAVERVVLKDEGGKLSENIKVSHAEISPNSYYVSFRVQEADGSEKNHHFRVSSTADCKHVKVRAL
jgi:hypothetical protein